MGDWRVRGIRGATTAPGADARSVLEATTELLERMVGQNGVEADDIAAVLFSVTSDLNRAFPARAARQLGWTRVPLLDLAQAPVEGDLPRCIRVLMLVNTVRRAEEMVHVYLHGAVALREDLARHG